MSDIVIRDVQSDDLPEIKAIIGASWDWAELFETPGALEATLGMYLNQVLYDSSFGKAALYGGKLVGVIFGCAEGDEPTYRMLTEDSTYHTLALLNATDEERASVYDYMSKTLRAYEQMLDEAGPYDGTLDFFVVSKEARGLNIGKRLWKELAGYLQDKRAQSIYVCSDTTCNFGFYEHMGFVKRVTREMTYVFGDEREHQTLFLYDYKFD
ncbi:MAG: GNAT family N-acetyltransferase [Defluviitaleaceae bacterium]|nr:GNAT family N-acetyltransferase [Defluviitaleaceae bacterium]